MTVKNLAALSTLPLLAGCFGDDPENTPLYGQWEMVRTLDSVTIDGIAFAPDELPDDFRELEQVESICGEPIYTDRRWQAEDVRDRTRGMCELETYTNGSGSAELAGRCSMDGNGVTYTPTMRGNSRFDQTSTRDVIVMEGSITMPGESGLHVMKMIAVQEGTRIGDC